MSSTPTYGKKVKVKGGGHQFLPPADSSLTPTRSQPRARVNHGNAATGPSKLANTNPLKADPILVALLERLDNVSSYEAFDQWKEEFLHQFGTYLGDKTSAAKAGLAYQHFRDERMENITMRVKRAAAHVDDGSLSVDRVSVRARNNMNELSVGLQSTGEDVRALAPPTSRDESVAGYTKYHMGAVLVEDGFQEYERLTVCNDILKRLKDTCINDIADDKLLDAMHWYNESISQFVTLMEDLGLYKIMIKCQEFNPKMRPKEPKQKPKPKPASPKKEEPEEELSGSNTSLDFGGELNDKQKELPVPVKPAAASGGAPTTPKRQSRTNYDVKGNWGSMSFSELSLASGKDGKTPNAKKKKKAKKKRDSDSRAPEDVFVTPARNPAAKSSRLSNSIDSLPELDLDDSSKSLDLGASSHSTGTNSKRRSKIASQKALDDETPSSPTGSVKSSTSIKSLSSIKSGGSSRRKKLAYKPPSGAPKSPGEPLVEEEEETAGNQSKAKEEAAAAPKENTTWMSVKAKPRMSEAHAAAKKAEAAASADSVPKTPKKDKKVTPKAVPPKVAPPKVTKELQTKTKDSKWNLPMDPKANPDEVWNRASEPTMRPKKSKAGVSDDQSVMTNATEPVLPSQQLKRQSQSQTPPLSATVHAPSTVKNGAPFKDAASANQNGAKSVNKSVDEKVTKKADSLNSIPAEKSSKKQNSSDKKSPQKERKLETIGSMPAPTADRKGSNDDNASVASDDDYTYVECHDEEVEEDEVDDEVTVSTEIYEAIKSSDIDDDDAMSEIHDPTSPPVNKKKWSSTSNKGPPKSIVGLPPRPPKNVLMSATPKKSSNANGNGKPGAGGDDTPATANSTVPDDEDLDDDFDDDDDDDAIKLSVRRLTFCSVDDSVDPKLLGVLSMCYPLVEWAVLFRPDKMGQPRYASLDWVQQLSTVASKSGGEMNLAAHLCGSLVDDLLRGDDSFLSRLPDMGFQRVQINATAINGVDTHEMEKFAENILSMAGKNKNLEIIIQQNKESKELWEGMLSGSKKLPKNITMLIDESKGRGIVPDRWKSPPADDRYLVGYAGGIGLGGRAMTKKTLKDVMKARNGKSIWISMETSLRSTINGKDNFDISKCYQIIDVAAENFIHLHPNFVS